MIKTLALFIFFAITAYNLRSELSPLTFNALLFLAALVLAVIYFLELIGHPVDINRP